MDVDESDTMVVSASRWSVPDVFEAVEAVEAVESAGEAESAGEDGEAEEVDIDRYRLRRRHETFRV
jgi:hypothetical protein